MNCLRTRLGAELMRPTKITKTVWSCIFRSRGRDGTAVGDKLSLCHMVSEGVSDFSNSRSLCKLS